MAVSATTAATRVQLGGGAERSEGGCSTCRAQRIFSYCNSPTPNTLPLRPQRIAPCDGNSVPLLPPNRIPSTRPCRGVYAVVHRVCRGVTCRLRVLPRKYNGAASSGERTLGEEGVHVTASCILPSGTRSSSQALSTPLNLPRAVWARSPWQPGPAADGTDQKPVQQRLRRDHVAAGGGHPALGIRVLVVPCRGQRAAGRYEHVDPGLHRR